MVCSHYMRDHVADIYDLEEQRVAVLPNGIDPLDLQAVEDLDALRARFAAPGERLIILIGRLVYEKGFQLALEGLPGVIERLGDVRFLVAGSVTHEAELRRQATALGLDPHGSFLGWIGDDVVRLRCYRIATCRGPVAVRALRVLSRSRRWLRVARASSPTPAACARSFPRTSAWACASTAATPSTWATMVERLLTDDALRERLVAEASEYVLRFDGGDVARYRGGYEAHACARSAGSASATSAAPRACGSRAPGRRPRPRCPARRG